MGLLTQQIMNTEENTRKLDIIVIFLFCCFMERDLPRLLRMFLCVFLLTAIDMAQLAVAIMVQGTRYMATRLTTLATISGKSLPDTLCGMLQVFSRSNELVTMNSAMMFRMEHTPPVTMPVEAAITARFICFLVTILIRDPAMALYRSKDVHANRKSAIPSSKYRIVLVATQM